MPCANSTSQFFPLFSIKGLFSNQYEIKVKIFMLWKDDGVLRSKTFNDIESFQQFEESAVSGKAACWWRRLAGRCVVSSAIRCSINDSSQASYQTLSSNKMPPFIMTRGFDTENSRNVRWIFGNILKYLAEKKRIVKNRMKCGPSLGLNSYDVEKFTFLCFLYISVIFRKYLHGCRTILRSWYPVLRDILLKESLQER